MRPWRSAAAVKQEAPDLEVKMIRTNEVRRVLSGTNTEQVDQPIIPDHGDTETPVLEVHKALGRETRFALDNPHSGLQHGSRQEASVLSTMLPLLEGN